MPFSPNAKSWFQIAAAVALLAVPFATSAGATQVVLPDPGNPGFIDYGAGTASVTYNGVTFSTNANLSDGNFYDVGSYFSGAAAVLSSQQQTEGVANIDISLPTLSSSISLDYGTFNGSSVTFDVYDGNTLVYSVVDGTTGNGYVTSQNFQFSDATGFTSVLVTSGDSVLSINDISFDPIPEPTSLALLGTAMAAFAGLFMLRRRKSTV